DPLVTGVQTCALPIFLATVFADRKYAAYIDRQRAEIRRHAELEHKRLPHSLDYDRFESLRAEARQALSRFRPATFGQAGRLEGRSEERRVGKERRSRR